MTLQASSINRAKQHYEKRDFISAFKIYKELAEEGDSECQAFLGSMYMYGEGTETDLKEALRWFNQAAMQGNSMARFWGGKTALRQGKADEARKWFSWGCEGQLSASCFWLGWLLYQGKGGPTDLKKAYQLFSLAYKRGHLPSGRAKAAMLIKGYGGNLNRIYGLGLFIKVACEVIFWSIKDRKTQKLLQ